MRFCSFGAIFKSLCLFPFIILVFLASCAITEDVNSYSLGNEKIRVVIDARGSVKRVENPLAGEIFWNSTERNRRIVRACNKT